MRAATIYLTKITTLATTAPRNHPPNNTEAQPQKILWICKKKQNPVSFGREFFSANFWLNSKRSAKNENSRDRSAVGDYLSRKWGAEGARAGSKRGSQVPNEAAATQPPVDDSDVCIPCVKTQTDGSAARSLVHSGSPVS